MERREFVKNTLLAIVEGVEDAQDELGKDPRNALVGTGEGIWIPQTAMTVNFDVALAETSGREKGGRIGVAIPQLLEVGGTEGTKDSASSTTRIQFQVPIAYPRSKHP